MNLTEIEFRLEKASHLINEIKFCENILDELFFTRPTISVAPPPVEFFNNYTDSAYDSIKQAKIEYSQQQVESNSSDGLEPTLTPPSSDSRVPDSHKTEIVYPDNFGEVIGQRIRERRNAIGVTQKELSKLTGIKRPNIARLEKGQSLPNLNTLLKVSLALHISIQKLLAI